MNAIPPRTIVASDSALNSTPVSSGSRRMSTSPTEKLCPVDTPSRLPRLTYTLPSLTITTEPVQPMLGSCAVRNSTASAHASMTAFLPTYIKMETGNLWLAGIALTLFEAAGVAGVLTAGSISDWFGRRETLLVSLVGAPLFLFVFALSGGWVRVAALIFTGFTLLSTTPVMLALVQENARQAPAAANGLYMMIASISRSAVVVVVGFIADQIGLNATYLISAAIGLISIPFVLMLPRK